MRMSILVALVDALLVARAFGVCDVPVDRPSQAEATRPAPASRATVDVPRLLLLDAAALGNARARVRSGDASILPAWSALAAAADAALTTGPFAVTDKALVPPSGDKHDYMSQAPYWWPNPATASGLPYVQRDGERNPEINKIIDHQSMDRMVGAVQTLALAAYLGGEQKYAERAAQLLRAWFIDPATRMNPNLQYAQGIPGINTGRGIGLIETRGLTRIVDAVGLLETTASWPASDDRAIKDWFSKFVTWMRETKNGRDEAAAKNNHGTYYDLQISCFALFVDRPELAREILTTARQKRIATQIEPDGRQPLELARTRSWSYSVMNAAGLTELAVLGEHVGVDLWHFTTPDARGIRAVLLYLAPYALGDSKWPGKQISGWTPEEVFPVLRRAAPRYGDSTFAATARRLPPLAAADRGRLLTSGSQDK